MKSTPANVGAQARKVGGGTGARVQGRSKGTVAPGKMQGFNPKKQTGGNRNPPK